MSSVGLVNSVNASSVVDKLQHAHQAQEETGRVQAGARFREQSIENQKKIAEANEEEKVRWSRKRAKDDETAKKKDRKNGSSDGDPQEESVTPNRRSGNLDITV